MFAIIKTGGKQYKVTENEIIKVEKLVGALGDSIIFSDVLMMGEGNSVKVGEPLVSNAKVCGTVLEQIRDDKVIIFKKKRRHNYRRKNGHRQYLTVVKITDILAEGEKPKASPVKTEGKAQKPVKEATPEVKAKAPTKKAAPETETPVKKAAPKAEAKAPAKKVAPKAKKPSKE